MFLREFWALIKALIAVKTPSISPAIMLLFFIAFDKSKRKRIEYYPNKYKTQH